MLARTRATCVYCECAHAAAIPAPFALRVCCRLGKGYLRLGQLTCSAASLMFEDSGVKSLTVKDEKGSYFALHNGEISL
jgi:hypothetical protein